MAMDKEKLLAYFQEHYLSRQDVLYKLPLNVSIDAFWPELVKRRKANAIVLPLYNHAGMPYWYVQTDRMVCASERLCEEAMAQADGLDPYRVPMTSAMTEEMFFTSFVEGAQIPLQEAMDFLQRGTEPENIQEQMIWNNRLAWSGMVSSLYRPLDEQFIKTVVWTLTEEMDNAATDYRQTDDHPIAAMNNESYDLPSAFSLPDRMQEYYGFLSNGNIHPLIKAAVGQAYILVTRPFPEGNERLARMMSAAVLLRSGYDFFRDVSLSGVIAKESYRYYKCMCEILRSENGGDLTYFIEYFLELLVRALEFKKARDRRKVEESIAQEQQLAREPFQSIVPASAYPPSRPDADENNEETPIEELPSESVSDEAEKPPAKQWPLRPLRQFLDTVDRLKYSPHPKCREYPAMVRAMIAQGMTSFTVSDWARIHDVDRKNADHQCRALYTKGMLDKHMGDGPMRYSFRIMFEEGEEVLEMVSSELKKIDESPPGSKSFEEKVEALARSKSRMRRRTAEVIKELIQKGVYTFRRADWKNHMNVSKETAYNSCDVMLGAGIIYNMTPNQKAATYHFCFDEASASETDLISAELKNELIQMTANSESARDQRIGSYLLRMIENNDDIFATHDWSNFFGISKNMCCSDIRRAVNLGLIRKTTIKSTDGYLYKLCKDYHKTVRASDLTLRQKEYLTLMYGTFGNEEFNVEDCARLLSKAGSGAQFHINNFAERGILEMHRRPGKAYSYIFAVTSEEYPECFTQISGPVPVQDDVAEAIILENQTEANRGSALSA